MRIVGIFTLDWRFFLQLCHFRLGHNNIIPCAFLRFVPGVQWERCKASCGGFPLRCLGLGRSKTWKGQASLPPALQAEGPSKLSQQKGCFRGYLDINLLPPSCLRVCLSKSSVSGKKVQNHAELEGPTFSLTKLDKLVVGQKIPEKIQSRPVSAIAMPIKLEERLRK